MEISLRFLKGQYRFNELLNTKKYYITPRRDLSENLPLILEKAIYKIRDRAISSIFLIVLSLSENVLAML